MTEESLNKHSTLEHIGRLVFIDPSKVNGTWDKDNSVEFTPPYEDMCIAFDLIIETYSRFDNKFRNELKFSGTSKLGENSILQGELRTKDNKVWEAKYDENEHLIDDYTNNYLTTYYTEISSDGYSKQEKLEGLGVESIQIAYDNYYVPTVTIKFIDVRGSALFGREEALHTDNNGNGVINGDNIFSAFFTIPYPKFKLQIKGFYGQAVTYQLTCSGFDASFNAKTGNVEAVAKFVAYNWSLLTDVPLEYLVAAPYCSYVGQEYWNRQINNAEKSGWVLKNDPRTGCTRTQPMTLFDLSRIIEECLAEVPDGSKSGDNIAENNASSDKEILINLRSAITNYLNSVGNKGIVSLADINKDDVENYYSEIKRYFEAYNSGDRGNNVDYSEDEHDLPENGLVQTEGGSGKITKKIYYCYQNAERYVDANGVPFPDELTDYVIYKNTAYAVNNEFIRKLSDNDYNKETHVIKAPIPSKSVIEYESLISHALKNFENKDNTSANPYDYSNAPQDIVEYSYKGCLAKVVANEVDKKTVMFSTIDFNYLLQQIDNEKTIIERTIQNIKKQALIDFVKGALTKLDIDPNIHNIFKILFCHLETLCHILYEAGKEIQTQINNGERAPSAMGVDIKNTDIPKRFTDIQFPAWTAVFNENEPTEITDTKLKYSTQYKWVGDLTGNKWIEADVVRSFIKAVNKTSAANNNEEAKSSDIVGAIWTLPMDINNNVSPFESIVNTSFTNICASLGIRCAQLFGLNKSLSDVDVQIMGKLDAYNFYNACRDAEMLKKQLKFDENNNPPTSDTIIGINLCSSEYENYETQTTDNETFHYAFESERIRKINNIDRHPILVESGSYYTYWYLFDKDGYSLLPSKLIDLSNKGYNKYIDIDDSLSDKLCFKGIVNNGNYYNTTNKWLYSNKQQILDEEDINENVKKYQFNHDNFKIIDEKKDVEKLLIKYKKLSSDAFKVFDYQVSRDTDRINFINKYWKVSTEEYGKSLTEFPSNLIGKSLSSLEIDENKIGEVVDKVKYSTICEIKNNGNVNGECSTYVFDDENNNNRTFKDDQNKDINIDDLFIKDIICRDKDDNNAGSLFAHPFYYMQNQIEDDEIRLKTKALLFLASLCSKPKYVIEETLDINQSKNSHFLIYNKASVLYAGGLLWRNTCDINSNGTGSADPIRYYSNEAGSIRFKEYYVNSLLENTTSYGIVVEKTNGIEQYVEKQESFYILDDNPNVRQQLIYYFEQFVNNEFKTICTECELRKFNGEAFKDGNDFEEYIKENKNSLGKFINKGQGNTPYLCFYESDTNLRHNLLFSETTQKGKKIQGLIKNIIFDNVIIMKSGINNDSNKKDITFNKARCKSYLESFLKTSKEIYDAVVAKDNASYTNNTDEEDKDGEAERNIATYIYLKNLWDKWLVQVSGTEYENDKSIQRFDVKTFFENFVFIDSYYNDISNKLKINLQEFNRLYVEGQVNQKHLYGLIGDIVAAHRCLFVALPDYVHLGLGQDGNGDEGIVKMETLFKPVPYSQMRQPSCDNHFVIIYTYGPASELPAEYSYKFDGFDIYSLSMDSEAEQTLNRLFGDTQNEIGKYGYNVPSFSVAFGKQNNSIFKDFAISMKNPVMTEQAIKTQVQIANLAKANTRAVCFYGQDVYNIYSNYSYTIEIEMMGNAQIQPLMYFQLLNIPMWRGAYMIYKVVHNMTPGNMTTRITAMKMSKRPVPILSKFFDIAPDIFNDGLENYGSAILDANGRVLATPSQYAGIGNYEDLGASDLDAINNKATPRGTNPCSDIPAKYLNMCHNNYMMNDARLVFNIKGTDGKNRTYNLSKAINVIYNFAHWAIKDYEAWDKTQIKACSPKKPWYPNGMCAHYVFTAVGAGFGEELSTGDAWDDKTVNELIKLGFKRIYDGSDNTSFPNLFYPGDIVLQKYGNSGHATMWTGERWVSDFIQRNGLKSAHDGQGIFALFRIPDIENKITITNGTDRINGTTGGKSIFQSNPRYDFNAVCQPQGRFEYTFDNIKKCVLYFVAHGEGGLRRRYGRNYEGSSNILNPITDYCGIAKCTDKDVNQNINPSFFTSDAINKLSSYKQNEFCAALDENVFNFYFNVYYKSQQEFLEKCRNPFTRYIGILAMKAGSGYYNNGWQNVGGKDMSKLSDFKYTSRLAEEWIKEIKRGYGTGNKAYWNSVEKARLYNSIFN